MTKADGSEALSVFSEWFEEDHPSGYFTRGEGYNHNWKLTVEDGVGILSVVMEDVNSLDIAEFEWTLNLRS
jgi:hypothetical protein